MESSLLFNNEGNNFPSHEEQKESAEGFQVMNTAKFDKVSLASDGMLIWAIQPFSTDCVERDCSIVIGKINLALC